MRIVDTQEMKDIKSCALDKYDFSQNLIAENVGAYTSRLLLEKELVSSDAEFIFLIGKGNNGADGLSVARHMSTNGIKTRAIILFSDSELSENVLTQLNLAKKFGVITHSIESISPLVSYCHELSDKLVFIDAIFGAGVQLPLSNFLYEVIDFVNSHSELLISIDIPTGVEGDTGLIQGSAMCADHTLAIGFPKTGYYIADGAKLVGEISFIDIGLPFEFSNEGDKFLLSIGDVINTAQNRDQFADKKIYGHALILGGSHGLVGSPCLSAHACLKVGAGLVTVATWEAQYSELTARVLPEIRTGYLPQETTKWARLIKDLNKYSSIVIGPGMARSTRARMLVLEVLNNFDGPVVIDADAINVMNLKEDAAVFKMRNAPTVLTPHSGEFANFCNIEESELNKSPVKYLKNLVEQIHCTVLLKGPCTYIGLSDGKVLFNFFPNDGMATAGVGDVLSGILGGILAQSDKFDQTKSLSEKYAALNQNLAFGVLLHSIAGDFAARNLGVRTMSAKDIIEHFPDSFNHLDEQIMELQGYGVK